jgi:hypothetical protein
MTAHEFFDFLREGKRNQRNIRRLKCMLATWGIVSVGLLLAGCKVREEEMGRPLAESSSFGLKKKIGVLGHNYHVGDNDGLEKLEKRDRFIWDVSLACTEYMNGGIRQVFRNSSGDRISQTIEAFDAIGAGTSASILRKCCALFPGGMPSTDQGKRREQIALIEKKNQSAIKQFDGSLFNENVDGLLLQYWKSHEPPLDAVPASSKHKLAVLRLFVDLPVHREGDYFELSLRERVLWDICWFEAVVANWDLVAFWVRAFEGAHDDALLLALDAVGARNTARLARDIYKLFPGGRPAGEMLQRLQQEAQMVGVVKERYGAITVRDGVVRYDDWEEDLFALLLAYWNKT